MKTLITICFLLISMISLHAQQDTVKTINLLNDLTLNDTDTVALLPGKMIFTQRLLWGKKGLMRGFNRFELSPEERQYELKIRRTMLVTHQVMGFATMGGMIAQGIVGARLYNGQTNLKETHESLAALVNICYFTTASFSLFAPPKMVNERKGFSSIKIHKALAIIHFTGMIVTNILASQIEDHPNLRPYHRAAAFTTFGAFAASMIVIKF